MTLSLCSHGQLNFLLSKGPIVSNRWTVNDKMHLVVVSTSTHYTGVFMATILTALISQDTDRQTERKHLLSSSLFLPPPHSATSVHEFARAETPPARLTHPFSIQQQVDFEDHAVVDRDFLISVEDLKYPAEDGAVVNPRRAEAAFL